jgi:hypothetical protein
MEWYSQCQLVRNVLTVADLCTSPDGQERFLEQDLIPAAQKSGLLTAYLNL